MLALRAAGFLADDSVIGKPPGYAPLEFALYRQIGEGPRAPVGFAHDGEGSMEVAQRDRPRDVGELRRERMHLLDAGGDCGHASNPCVDLPAYQIRHRMSASNTTIARPISSMLFKMPY